MFVVLSNNNRDVDNDDSNLNAIANENSICSQDEKAIIMVDYDERKHVKSILVRLRNMLLYVVVTCSFKTIIILYVKS